MLPTTKIEAKKTIKNKKIGKESIIFNLVYKDSFEYPLSWIFSNSVINSIKDSVSKFLYKDVSFSTLYIEVIL